MTGGNNRCIDCLLEIAMLIRLASVPHQLIDGRRLLRMDVRTNSHAETQENACEKSAFHDETPFEVLCSEFCVLPSDFFRSLLDSARNASALALIEVPQVNVQVHAEEIHRYAHADIAVAVATAAGVLPSVARSMAELMTEPLAETPERTIAAAALPRALALLKGKNAVLVGPGLSTNASTAEFVLGLLPKIEVPCVIDADGLNIVATRLDVLGGLKAPAVLTPHPGEFARLVGLTTKEVIRHRLEIVPEFAAKHGIVLVLKGYRTLVAAPDGRVFVNPTGNPGMATGGTGDVLGGLIASQIAQKNDLLGAVLSAVYAHGLAGDVAADRLSEKSLVAGDLIRYLPPALKELAGE